MPSTSLQSRIQAFEALSSSSSTTTPITTLTPSTPTPGRRTSFSNLLESPISPTASSFQPITPLVAPVSSNRSRSPSPTIARQTSLIDLKDWIVEDGPVEPFSLGHTLVTGTGKLNGIRDPSETSSPSRKHTPTHDTSNVPTALISLELPQKSRPPLPPRKPSFNTTDRVFTQRFETGVIPHPPGRPDSLTSEHTYPPGPHKFGISRMGHTSASSVSSFHSVSLSLDGTSLEVHSPNMSSKPPSFTFEVESGVTDTDAASITESFENVSAPSVTSPSTVASVDWDQTIGKSGLSTLAPPTLPTRPLVKMSLIVPPKPIARSMSGSSSSTTTSTNTRRPPPPPPPYQPRSRPSSSRASVVSTSASTSDRSSILSNATTTSRTSVSTRNSAQFGGAGKSSPLLRPTPVPPAARSRYESLFDSAVRGRRQAEKKAQKTKLLTPPHLTAKKRQAAGWRGVSVDLIIHPEDDHILSSGKGLDESSGEEEATSPVGSDQKLSGRIVKHIWGSSHLDGKKLRNIWSDCDPQCTGFIDRDAFVSGMWRIDEELRRAQLARRTSALTAASSQRIPHRPLPPTRPQTTARLPM